MADTDSTFEIQQDDMNRIIQNTTLQSEKLEPCKWCADGDRPHFLDADGTLVSITGNEGVLSHAYDVYWWPCLKFGVELRCSRAPVVAPQGDAAFRQRDDVNGKPLEVILGQLGSPASREDVENFRRLIEDIRRDERAASSPSSSVPPEQTDVNVGLWFKSAVSGLWYAKREAAGDISAVCVEGVRFEPVGPRCDLCGHVFCRDCDTWCCKCGDGKVPAATPAPVEQERYGDDLISRKAAIDLINVCTCGSGPEFRSVGMRHHAIMCQTHVATLLLTLPAAAAPSPSAPTAVTEAGEQEITRLRQAIGWICDACDAAYIEDPNNERIHELFNIAAQAAGLTRRLPDEHGRFDETMID